MFGFEFVCACPEGYEPDRPTVERAQSTDRSDIRVTHRLPDALRGADVVYTDVWASMGQKDEAEKRKRDFSGFQVSMAWCDEWRAA